MQRARANSWFARIAAVVFVLMALAPSVSRLIGFANSEPTNFTALCATAGAPATPDSAAAALDCPMCLVQASGLMSPPRPLDIVALLLSFGSAVPLLFLRAPRPLFAWAVAQPRAPPCIG